MLLSKVPEKHPKLVLMFEKETGKNAIFKKSGKITKQFTYWLRQKIKYKTLKCNDPNCPKFGQEFPSKMSFSAHRRWHNKEYRENQLKIRKKLKFRKKLKKIQKETHNTPEAIENHSKAMTNIWNQLGYRESRSGENHPNYGKFGKESFAFKEDAKNCANHM